MAIARYCLCLSAVLVLGASLASQAKVDFASEVLPIFEKRCFTCHSATYRDEGGRLREPRAGLRLDGRGWILRGSDYSEILDPGNVEDSLIYELISLPADDELRMPAKGDPLLDAEIETIRRWIAGGAGFGGWHGAAGGQSRDQEVVIPVRTLLFQSLAEGLRPAAKSVLDRAAGNKAQITPVLPGSPLLRVQFSSHQEAVGDQEVVALMPLRASIGELNLSRSKITAASLPRIGRMPRLIRLDLHQTAIGDASLAALVACQELRYLNLYGTRVGDAGLRMLGKLTNLQALYLWNSRVTEKGVAALELALPDCKIHFLRDLPK